MKNTGSVKIIPFCLHQSNKVILSPEVHEWSSWFEWSCDCRGTEALSQNIFWACLHLLGCWGCFARSLCAICEEDSKGVPSDHRTKLRLKQLQNMAQICKRKGQKCWNSQTKRKHWSIVSHAAKITATFCMFFLYFMCSLPPKKNLTKTLVYVLKFSGQIFDINSASSSDILSDMWSGTFHLTYMPTFDLAHFMWHTYVYCIYSEMWWGKFHMTSSLVCALAKTIPKYADINFEI